MYEQSSYNAIFRSVNECFAYKCKEKISQVPTEGFLRVQILLFKN